jgi:predicted dehydrogenase
MDGTNDPMITPISGLGTHHPFDAEIDQFIGCIRNEVESHGSMRDGVNTHEAIRAIDQSSRDGRTPTALPVSSQQ